MGRADSAGAARPAQPGGGGSSPTSALHVAHQRLVREREARQPAHDLFGQTHPEHPDIKSAVVRKVNNATAAHVILRYEWLGTMPAKYLVCYGIFFDGACGGVVIYGQEPAENLGVWDRYGYTGKIIALLRGACVHWAHPHAASKLIRRSMAMLPTKYRVITATVDPAAGEVGTIYQACGFDYVGAMSKGHKTVRNHDGTTSSDRHLRRRRGVVHGGRGLTMEPAIPKGRYFGFRGSPQEVATLREAIKHIIRPYPKRGAP